MVRGPHEQVDCSAGKEDLTLGPFKKNDLALE